MPIGRVDKVCFSRTNKPQIMMGGTYYRIEDHHGLTEGMYIDYDAHSWDYPKGSGKMFWGIDKWGPAKVEVSPATQLPVSPGPAAAGTLLPPPLLSEGERATISNIWAAAIEKGLISDPSHLELWGRPVLAFLRATPNHRMDQIAAKSAATKIANRDAERILEAFRAGKETVAVSIYEEVVAKEQEPQVTAVWAALPKTVQQRIEDLRDEKFIQKPNGELDDEVDF
jgi:hypothetical protein